MTIVLAVLAVLALLAWIYLLLFRRRFWLADQRLPRDLPTLQKWPSVGAIVPARNEADVVGEAVRSLLDQDYRGSLSVYLVDDHSTDGTAEAARAAAKASKRPPNLKLVPARPLEAGWTGKLSAMASGLDRLAQAATGPDYILFTDADIVHDQGSVARLVGKAEAGTLDLVSLMVRLHCRTAVERLLIPAFVFFFQKLYPFPASNDPRSSVAAAAGGCMLVRSDALDRAGGLAPIAGALIDDCALARLLKRGGPIWTGLADDETRSIRPYEGLGDIWRMVRRTAFTQLDYSTLNLVGTVAGMLVIYVAPVLALLWGLATVTPALLLLGLLSLVLMGLAYYPTWRLYGRLGAGFLGLPLAAALYTLMTIDSALQHWRGRGGGWKERTYDRPARRRSA